MRRIDPKFHIDGEQIIKSSNREPLPEDEPVFLLRARDRLALALLQVYRILSAVDGCGDYQMSGIEERVDAFRRFALWNPDRMKQPGVTRGK